MKRLLLLLALIPSVAFAGADKPLVNIGGTVKSIPAGDTLLLNPATTANASVRLPPGTAPTSPTDGDCWTTTAGLYCRINGVSVGPFGTGSGSGSVTSVGTGTGLMGGPITTTGTISLDAIADQRVLANVSGGSTAPTATAFSSLTGVGSALKWTTGRTIALTGDTTGLSGAFDGSGNLSFATTGVQAAKWTTARTLSFTGDATGSGSVDGSASVATALTLATVNSNVGTFGDASNIAQFTVNGKGLITAASNVAITVPAGANPSASVGLSAVNGVATTFQRSDGAPPLSQAIAPTWTAQHIWTPAAGVTPIKVTTVSQTVSTPILDLAQTWNGAGVAFTGIKLNITNTASSSLSPLIDLQFGTVTKFKVDTQGVVTASDSVRSAQNFWANTNAGIFYIGSGADAILTRRGAANFQLGAADAASPVAQALTAQGSRSGTDTNVAGGSLTIQAGRGTGNATGSSLIFQAPVAVASGTGAQTQTTALTLTGASATVAVPLTSGAHTMTVASALSVASGTNQRAGNATLVGGTVTVANTTVTANTVVMLTRKTSGGTIGTAITYTLSAATSFTITSDNILDTSTFSYFLIEVP